MTYCVPEIPAETIVDVVEAIWFLRETYDIGRIAEYVEETEERAERGLEGGLQLGYLKDTEDPQGPYTPCRPQARFLANACIDDRTVLFKMQLMEYPPFRFFFECVSRGSDSIQSASKVKTVFSIDSAQNIIKHSFTEWGVFAGLFYRQDGRLTAAIDHNEVLSKYLVALNKVLDDERMAHSFVMNKITSDCYDFLERTIQEDLASVIVRIANDEADQRQTLVPLGTAFEAFLRQIARSESPEVDLSDCRGISQMADRLRNRGAMASKHTAMAKYIAAARNAASHDSDPEEGRPWSFSNESVFDITMTTVNTMRSICEYHLRQGALFF